MTRKRCSVSLRRPPALATALAAACAGCLRRLPAPAARAVLRGLPALTVCAEPNRPPRRLRPLQRALQHRRRGGTPGDAGRLGGVRPARSELQRGGLPLAGLQQRLLRRGATVRRHIHCMPSSRSHRIWCPCHTPKQPPAAPSPVSEPLLPGTGGTGNEEDDSKGDAIKRAMGKSTLTLSHLP